jgi:hypothetical protein
MKTENPEPNEGRLSDLLRESRPAPPLPPRFQEAVWRRIEKAEAPSNAPSPPVWLDWLVERLLRPRFALASITALLLVSGLAGALRGTEMAKQAAQVRYLSTVAPHTVR